MHMVMCVKYFLVVMACGFLFTISADNPSSSSSPSHSIKQEYIDSVADSFTQFGLNLYHSLSESDENNLFFSPMSIMFALGLVHLGSLGKTREQLQNVVFNSGKDSEDFLLHVVMKYFHDTIHIDNENMSVNSANRLYVRDGFSVSKEFQSHCQTFYGSDMASMDLRNEDTQESARQEINIWVEKQTKNKIRHLFKKGDLNSLVSIVVVNAIYFKGNWANKFNPEYTQMKPFYLKDGTEVQVMTMELRKRLSLGHDAELAVSVLELPYDNGKFSMFVYLPDKSNRLENFEKAMQPHHLYAPRDAFNLNIAKVDLTLPKFVLSQDFSLEEELKKLGIKDLFDPSEADLSGIDGSRSLHVSSVVHKAFVSVDEQGTTASAATGVRISTRSVPIVRDFHVNRPFLFTIRHIESGGILFYGKVTRPQLTDPGIPQDLHDNVKIEL